MKKKVVLVLLMFLLSILCVPVLADRFVMRMVKDVEETIAEDYDFRQISGFKEFGYVLDDNGYVYAFNKKISEIADEEGCWLLMGWDLTFHDDVDNKDYGWFAIETGEHIEGERGNTRDLDAFGVGAGNDNFYSELVDNSMNNVIAHDNDAYLCDGSEGWVECNGDRVGRLYAKRDVRKEDYKTSKLYECDEDEDDNNQKYREFDTFFIHEIIYDEFFEDRNVEDYFLDEHSGSGGTYYTLRIRDEDEDGYIGGDLNVYVGYDTLPNGDCDDDDPDQYPGKEATATACFDHGKDHDCDGTPNIEDPDCAIHLDKYVDNDGDGFAEVASGDIPGGDCNDGSGLMFFMPFDPDAAEGYTAPPCPELPIACTHETSKCSVCIHPKGGPNNLDMPFEYCDGEDNDCDQLIDESCEGDMLKMHCKGRWFGEYEAVGNCCGDDKFNQAGGMNRADPRYYNNENKLIISGETFISDNDDAPGACFNGQAFVPPAAPTNTSSTMAFFMMGDFLEDSVTPDNPIVKSNVRWIKSEDLYRKMKLRVEINSESDVYLVLRGKPIDSYVRPVMKYTSIGGWKEDIIFATLIPSTNGTVKHYEIDFIAPSQEFGHIAFDELLAWKFYGIQLTASLAEGAEGETSILANYEPVYKDKVHYSYDDKEFYSCTGIDWYGNVVDDSQYMVEVSPQVRTYHTNTYTLIGDETDPPEPPSYLPRGVTTIQMTGLDEDAVKPDYSGTKPFSTLESAIPAENYMKVIDGDIVCPEVDNKICQVDGKWDEREGVGENLKPLPFDVSGYIPQKSGFIHITGMKTYEEALEESQKFSQEPSWTATEESDTEMAILDLLSPYKVTPLPQPRYSHGCCEDNYCWNGYTCVGSTFLFDGGEIDSQEYGYDSTILKHDNESYACVGGEWLEIEESWDQYHYSEGFCPQAWCYNNAGAIDNPYDNYCIPDQYSYYKFYCNDGTWATRDELIASELLNLVPEGEDYTLFCGKYDKALNKVDYNSNIPLIAGDQPGEIEGYLEKPYLYEPDEMALVTTLIHLITNKNNTLQFSQTNNFCAVVYNDGSDNQVVVGTSLNIPPWWYGAGSEDDARPFLWLIQDIKADSPGERPQHTSYCDGVVGLAYPDPADYNTSTIQEYFSDVSTNRLDTYYGCDGADSYIEPNDDAQLWYNPTKEILIFSKDEFAMEDTSESWQGDLQEDIEDPLNMFAEAVTKLFIEDETKQEYFTEYFQTSSKLSNIYLAQKEGRSIMSVLEPSPDGFGNSFGILYIAYRGFDHNFCEDKWDDFITLTDYWEGCEDNVTCFCDYDEGDDIVMIMAKGMIDPGDAEDTLGSFVLMPDLTSKIRPAEEGAWYEGIINFVNMILDYIFD